MGLRYRVLLAVFLTMGLTGCLGSLTSAPPPQYYEVDYAYEPAPCPGKFDSAIRVWPLSASSPCDREEMIILGTSSQVHFSPQYRWVALPGQMIANRLLQDLVKSELFSRAVMAGDPFSTPLQLGGSVFQFAWREEGTMGHAVLDVELSLWTEEPQRRVLFRRSYHLVGPSVSESSSQRLAESMSGLVKKLSFEVREDLCHVMSGGSSSPTGG